VSKTDHKKRCQTFEKIHPNQDNRKLVIALFQLCCAFHSFILNLGELLDTSCAFCIISLSVNNMGDSIKDLCVLKFSFQIPLLASCLVLTICRRFAYREVLPPESAQHSLKHNYTFHVVRRKPKGKTTSANASWAENIEEIGSFGTVRIIVLYLHPTLKAPDTSIE
jgi:hypothetical protein